MNNGTTVKDLSLMLEVSEMTMKGLCLLEAEGLIHLVHRLFIMSKFKIGGLGNII